ncbi:carboxypeptidase regulatory-like domain-containing protein [Aquisediminimonas sediminicola]|uniref:carboxypeptidase regulatory-like domain-containing protein n=1 Tax=Alteraquisediminimonas sediminicola TaxID=2676787 RepID=UPI001C8E67BB|nr:carboxypeptidase regulatory-like domain-containing protein [Aquisediminimonas sediminicola]
MNFRTRFKMRHGLMAVAALALIAPFTPRLLHAAINAAQSGIPSADTAIVGDVRSDKEGAMEGVLVIARRSDSPVLIAVTSDAQGRFSFAREDLKPGKYDITIRAVGYALAPTQVTVGAKPAALPLQLTAVTDNDTLASQLTSLEWLNSFPGTDAQKDVMIRNMVNCAFCHSLERVARSSHDATDFLSVMQRMLTYETDHSSADRIQLAWPPQPTENLQWFGRDAKPIADWLSTVNLSNGRTDWSYPLKTLPRPTGEATKAVVTVYPIPREMSVIHDLDVDSKGNVWYGNTGWDFIGKLDPKTGKFSEWASPNALPAAHAPGTDRIIGVQDIQVDGEDNVWVAIGGTKHARFNPKTRKWQTFDLPVVWKNPFLGPVRPGETGLWATGLGAPPEGEKRHEQAFRLDIKTGQLSKGITLFDDMPAPNDPTHKNPLNYCYMMDQDADGDFLCTAPEPSGIVRANAHTGKARFIPTPTPIAYPRRGYRDPQNRFWFGEFYADKIGVIDLNNDVIREYPVGVKWISPYYARPDAKGRIWVSATGSDRLLRLDPKTGEIVQYLMPVSYDARKVVVDVRAAKTTIWLPNKNAAQLVRIEIPD